MASHVPPLAGKTVGLKGKTSAFEVRTKEKRCPRFVGFDPGFAGAECPRRKERAGQTASTPGVTLAEEDAAAEAEVVRVTAELVALVQPLLEEMMPCELRLMGVRVSSFRGAKATLQRGQQSLCRFLTAAAVSSQRGGGGSAVGELHTVAGVPA